MTSRELEYIKTVADEKSISSAARKLYIAQPSLSQSLQRIEENLGAKLFNRTPSGLTLTYAGERCYQMACQVLKIYSDFEAEISDINQLKTGRIVMGTTNHLGTVILPEILLEFKENSPSVELEILEDNTGNLEAKLLTGAMDFALLHAPSGFYHCVLFLKETRNTILCLFPDPSFSGKCTGYGCLGQLQLLRSFRQTDLFLHGFSSQNINFLFNCCPLI